MRCLLIGILLIGLIHSYGQEFQFAGNGTFDLVSKNDNCIPEEERQRISSLVESNISYLHMAGKLSIQKNNTPLLFAWPVKNAMGNDWSVHPVSNYVDHNSAVGPLEWNQNTNTNLDYNCGNQTYDTSSGYNHTGTDIQPFPFSWYAYEYNLVEVVSAADGVIVTKIDGNKDDNCECSGSANAIVIMHSDGSKTWYFHMKKFSLTTKAVGESVSKGEFLGVMGSSGCSTGPHLHFEVYDSQNNLIDPYAGNCNSLNGETSWWENQPAYTTPTLIAVRTQSSAPVSACRDDQPNFSRCFNPGSRVYISYYYMDQDSGVTTTMKFRRPNNAIYSEWTHASPQYYRNSYWYWWFQMPESSELGIWTIEGEFNGQMVSTDFIMTDQNCDCPQSYSNSNGNLLSGPLPSSNTYMTNGHIESSHMISGGNTSVSYHSASFVELLPGWAVYMGAKFESFIEGCQNMFSGKSREKE